MREGKSLAIIKNTPKSIYSIKLHRLLLFLYLFVCHNTVLFAKEENRFTLANAQWADKTNIHPLAVVLIILCGIAILRVPRRQIIFPFSVITCFISPVQKIVIFSLDFNITRIMVLFGVIRYIIRPEKIKFIWHPIDKLIIYFALAKLVIYTIKLSSFSALIYQLGSSFDAFGIYFIFRKSFTDWNDVKTTIQTFIFLSIPVALFFTIEYTTKHNLFSMFGGVPEITMEREGRLRCQGAFAHPIIAGCFWAALLPLMVALKWKMNRLKLLLTILPTLVIVFATASSTPLSALLIGAIGGVMFFYRKNMKRVRYFILVILVLAHLFMKGSVWSLIAKVNILGGSTSYYRFALLDGFITHVNEWWLLGTVSTSHWCWGCFDLTNQYVFEGVNGGLLSLILFFMILGKLFNAVGDSWRRVEKDKEKLAISWGCGVVLLVHCANFIGVSYFGQIITLWYIQLAMIVSIDVFTKKLASLEDAVK